MKKSKPTKRKFYGKWLYKVTLFIRGVYTIRYDFDTTKHFHPLFIDSSLIDGLVNKLASLPPDSWTKRIESDRIDIYTSDYNLYQQLSEQFAHCLIHRFEPVCDPDKLADSNVSVVNRYPHNRYQYKVFLTPHKFNKDQTRKQQFLEWIDTQGERIKISLAVKDWFIYMNWNWDRRYLYVQDEQTLLMLKMRESNAVGKVYKYTLADK